MLRLYGDSQTAAVWLDIPAVAARVCIPCPGIVAFAPAGFALSWSTGDARILERVEPIRVERGEPIPAELGAILSVLPAHWRDADFETYRWSAVPSVVVFDTASYTIQSRLFKRLAFFVEKKRYAGRIPDYESIAALHGFNAHDYAAEDLARFFALAARTETPLLAEERRLEEILRAAGILRGEGGDIRAGEGAVISISRESADALRLRFITHEALHGLYFVSASFRSHAAWVWKAASEDLKEYFRLYLSRPEWDYDLQNAGLLVNEFMAYLLQYPEEDLRTELFERGVSWIRERYPERRAWVDAFAGVGMRQILSAYRDLEQSLFGELGLRGGRLVGLRIAR